MPSIYLMIDFFFVTEDRSLSPLKKINKGRLEIEGMDKRETMSSSSRKLQRIEMCTIYKSKN